MTIATIPTSELLTELRRRRKCVAVELGKTGIAGIARKLSSVANLTRVQQEHGLQ